MECLGTEYPRWGRAGCRVCYNTLPSCTAVWPGLGSLGRRLPLDGYRALVQQELSQALGSLFKEHGVLDGRASQHSWVGHLRGMVLW